MKHPQQGQLKAIIARSNVQRQERVDQEASFKQAQKTARKQGLCDATVQALPSRVVSNKRTYWRDQEAIEASLIGEDAYENQVHQHRTEEMDKGSSKRFRTICCKPTHPGKGKCREHYLRERLHVSSLGDARGKRFRPFKGWQVPLGDMSEVQELLLEDRKRLPLSTPYEACISAMNLADPSHPLTPIWEPPARTPRRSRRYDTK